MRTALLARITPGTDRALLVGWIAERIDRPHRGTPDHDETLFRRSQPLLCAGTDADLCQGHYGHRFRTACGLGHAKISREISDRAYSRSRYRWRHHTGIRSDRGISRRDLSRIFAAGRQ